MRLIKGLAVTVVVLVFLLGATPLVGKWYLKNWLNQKGIDAVIKQFDVNYFFGRITIGSTSLSKDNVEQAGVFQFVLDFDIPELLQGRITLDEVLLDNVNFSVAKNGDQWQLAGLNLADWFGGITSERHVLIRRFEAINTDVCTVDRQQCLRLEELHVGRLNWGGSGQAWTLNHLSPLILSKVFLQDRDNSSSIFYLESLSLQESSYSSAATSLKDLSLRNFQLVESQATPNGQSATPYQTQVGELNIGKLDLQFGDSPSFRVSDINIISLRQAVERQKEEGNTWAERIKKWFPGVFGLWQSVRFDGTGTAAVAINNLELQGGRFTWRDNTVTPPALESLTQIKLTLDTIDSQTMGSDSSERTALTMDAKLGNIGSVKLEGRAQFFAGAPLFDVAGFIHGLDLGNISGYTNMLFDQRVTEGVVDISFDVGASAGQAAGQSSWRLMGLNTEGNASMSRAFVKLADHNNSVEFDLPIGLQLTRERGGPIIALGQAVKNTLTNLARGVKPKGNALVARPVPVLKLPPVFFGANEVSPAELDLPRIPDIAKELKDRPKASMVVCPVATGGEWAALFNGGQLPSAGMQPSVEQKQKLLDLTKQRGQMLSRMLVQEGLKASRIIVCGPSVDMSKSGPSLAAISI